MPGPDLIQRVVELIPPSLAWPLSALSSLAALGASALVFHAAAFGQPTSAIWGGIVFAVAGGLWYLSDLAGANRPM